MTSTGTPHPSRFRQEQARAAALLGGLGGKAHTLCASGAQSSCPFVLVHFCLMLSTVSTGLPLSQSTQPFLKFCVSTVRADVCAVSGHEARVQTSTKGQAVLAGGQPAENELASANTLIPDGMLNAEGRGGPEQAAPSSIQELADGEPCPLLHLQTLTPTSCFPVCDQSSLHNDELHLQGYCDHIAV